MLTPRHALEETITLMFDVSPFWLLVISLAVQAAALYAWLMLRYLYPGGENHWRLSFVVVYYEFTALWLTWFLSAALRHWRGARLSLKLSINLVVVIGYVIAVLQYERVPWITPLAMALLVLAIGICFVALVVGSIMGLVLGPLARCAGSPVITV